MSGWSGVALSGLGAGIGKALEPENVMRIKQFTDEIKWSEERQKIKEIVNKEFNELNEKSSNQPTPSTNPISTQNYNVSLSDSNQTLTPNYNISLSSASKPNEPVNLTSNYNISTSIKTDNAPKQYVFKPNDDTRQLRIAQLELKRAMEIGNMSAAQKAASTFDYYNKMHASKIQETAIQAYITENPELFSDALNMFHLGKGESLPDAFKGVPQFIKGGTNPLTGLPETYLQFDSGLKITPSDLNHMFTDNFRDLTQPDSFSRRGIGGGSGSDSKLPLFFNVNKNGEVEDKTSLIFSLSNQIGMLRRYNSSYDPNNPSKAEDVILDVYKFLDLSRANSNFPEELANIKYNPSSLNSPGNPLHHFLSTLQVKTDEKGKIVFDNDEMREKLEPYIMYLPSKNSDGTLENKYYFDIAQVARDYYSSSQKEQKQQEENPNRFIDIAKSYGTPFPTGDNKEKLKEQRNVWIQGLVKHILKTTDFNVTDAASAYYLANQIHDFYLRQPASIINRADITKQEDYTPSDGKPSRYSVDPLDLILNTMIPSLPKQATYKNYDMPRAILAGYKPNSNGHWPSVHEATKEEIKDYGLVDGSFYSLKQYNHPTLNLSVDEESKLGRKPVQHILNKVIFFIPKDAELPPNMIDYKVDMQSSQTNNQNTQNTQNNKNTKSNTAERQVLSIRKNNPGALEYRDFFKGYGAIKDGRFALFRTPEEGVKALYKQIDIDADRGHTLSSLLYKYAPKGENNTEAYIKFVSEKTGIGYSEKIAGKDYKALAMAITQIEGGKDALNYFFGNNKNTNLMANNTVSTNQNASQKLNNTIPSIPLSMMNPVLAMSAGNNSKLQSITNKFNAARKEISAIYNEKVKSLTNTGKKPKVNKNSEGFPFDAAASITSYLGGVLKVLESKKENNTGKNNTGIGKSTSSEFEISSMLRPLPAPLKLFLSNSIVKTMPGMLKDTNFSNVYGKTDVEAFVQILKTKRDNKGGVDGSEWEIEVYNPKTGKKEPLTDRVTLAMRQFGYGGVSYEVSQRDKNGYPTKFIIRDTYDFNNPQRRPRVKQIERDRKNMGDYNAFVKNLKDAWNHVNTADFKNNDQPVYTKSRILSNSYIEFFSRAFGEFFMGTGTNASFDSEISVVYGDDGEVIDYKIRPVKIVR